jgi:hypothetical protein
MGPLTASMLAWAWLAAEPSAVQKAADANPRVAVAGSALLGPHAIGNQECRSEAARCETRGGFFGLGASAEVRVRLASVFSLHARPWAVGNVAPDKVFSGVLGGGLGLGAYGRHVFGRAEYIALHTVGDDRFTPPFFDAPVARDRWGNHAGMVAVGFRKSVHPRVKLELWGGPMFGPTSRRSFPDGTVDRRTLVTFMVGLGAAFDALPGPWRPRG